MEEVIGNGNQFDSAYLALAEKILSQGGLQENRTGVRTRGLFGETLKVSPNGGFPLLTTKKVFFRGVAVELEMFLRGETNAKFLQERGVHIWDEWAREDGDLGPVYGKQWRSWESKDGRCIDQLQNVIDGLALGRRHSQSRRLLVSALNVGEVDEMVLWPCHMFFQVCELANGKIRMTVYMRSCDVFLGLPFNIASYWLLLELISRVSGKSIDDEDGLTFFFGDVHIYENHLDQLKTQMARPYFQLPRLVMPRYTSINEFDAEQVRVDGYVCGSALRGEVAV